MILVSTVKRQFQFQFGKMMDPRKFEIFLKMLKKNLEIHHIFKVAVYI